MAGDGDAPVLAWVDSCLPVEGLEERLDLASRHELALEVAHDGALPIETLQRSPVPIAAVQAWRMHDLHPLHPGRRERRRGLEHLCDTIEVADRLDARRVVTVCGYGKQVADSPFERCLDFFDAAGKRARELGVRLMIEPLSPLRVSVMTDPREIVQLIDTLDQAEVFGLLLDTGHLLDSEVDLDEFFGGFHHVVEELQLRGADDQPPEVDWPYEQWLAALPEPPAVVSGEYRKPITTQHFEALIERLQGLAS